MKRPIPFGKYFLIDRVAVGGMAEVFKAKTIGVEGFERLIAIKRILPNIAEDRDFIDMFKDEARLAVQLTHPAIGQVYELGRIDGSYYIAMEFISGKDLRAIWDRLRKQGRVMEPQMAAYVMLKVCEGLDYAHRKRDAQGADLGIVHRDVSPQNMLCSYEGDVKLIDFGIAKAASKSTRTQAGILKGKFSYMSPEQVQGKAIDRRSDLFAIGTVLHELLTGKRLFASESDFSTLEKIREGRFEAPVVVNENVPPELDAVVLKCLARDPELRYQWAADIALDLQRYLMQFPRPFNGNDLTEFMKQTFASDIDRERQVLLHFAQVEHDMLPHVGPPQVASTASLGTPPTPVGAPQAGAASSVGFPAPSMSGEAAPPKPPRAPAVARSPGPPPLASAPRMQTGPGPVAPPVTAPQPSSAGAPGGPVSVQNQPSLDLDYAAANRALGRYPDFSPSSTRPPPGMLGAAGVNAASAGARSRASAGAADVGLARRKERGLSGVAWAGIVALVMLVLAAVVWFGVKWLERERANATKTTVTTLAPGSLEFSVFPQDARIYVDNKLVGSNGRVNLDGIEPGMYKVLVKRDQFEAHEESIELGPGETVKRVIELPPVNKTYGSVEIISDPAGAALSLDGRVLFEPTPTKLGNIAAGVDHTLILSREDFEETVVKFRVNEHETEKLVVKLPRKRFAATIESEPPGAGVFIADRFIGNTPVRAERIVACGESTDIELRYGRSFAKRETIMPTASECRDQRSVRRYMLGISPNAVAGDAPQAEAMGRLSLNVRPGAKVFVDGRDTGQEAPLLGFPLTAGRHTVRIVNEALGCDKNFDVVIEEGEELNRVESCE